MKLASELTISNSGKRRQNIIEAKQLQTQVGIDYDY
jgi:hypothetical protein